MTDEGAGHDQLEYAMGYECPKCGAVGGHMRTRYGPPNDGKNLERYCRECNTRFLITDAEFKDLEHQEGESSDCSCGIEPGSYMFYDSSCEVHGENSSRRLSKVCDGCGEPVNHCECDEPNRGESGHDSFKSGESSPSFESSRTRKEFTREIERTREHIHDAIRGFQDKHRDVPYPVKSIVDDKLDDLKEKVQRDEPEASPDTTDSTVGGEPPKTPESVVNRDSSSEESQDGSQLGADAWRYPDRKGSSYFYSPRKPDSKYDWESLFSRSTIKEYCEGADTRAELIRRIEKLCGIELQEVFSE